MGGTINSIVITKGVSDSIDGLTLNGGTCAADTSVLIGLCATALPTTSVMYNGLTCYVTDVSVAETGYTTDSLYPIYSYTKSVTPTTASPFKLYTVSGAGVPSESNSIGFGVTCAPIECSIGTRTLTYTYTFSGFALSGSDVEDRCVLTDVSKALTTVVTCSPIRFGTQTCRTKQARLYIEGMI